MQPFKRRKLEQTHRSLTKPFRSPLHADISQSPIQSGTDPEDPHNRHLSKIVPHGPMSTQESSRLHMSGSIPASTFDSNALQKESSILSKHITTLRQLLDTAQQAMMIHETKKDAEILASIAKWKQIVRDAAEELLADAQEAFKADPTTFQQRKDNDMVAFWEVQEHEDVSAEMKEMLTLQKAEARAEARRYGLLSSDDTEDGVESRTLSMEQMLLQMNVDLDLVGYDEKSQRWVD